FDSSDSPFLGMSQHQVEHRKAHHHNVYRHAGQQALRKLPAAAPPVRAEARIAVRPPTPYRRCGQNAQQDDPDLHKGIVAGRGWGIGGGREHWAASSSALTVGSRIASTTLGWLLPRRGHNKCV